jgi:hypothetical protein
VKRLPWVVLWAIAFAYVESAVVEYLRAVYYPLSKGGFQFPTYTLEQLAALGDEHTRRLAIEFGRELSTLVMLATLGMLAGRNHREAWAHFMVAFGVWDIFFYLWLKLFIDWPSGLMTWDLLFLIPVPWVSPVLAPIIISVVMIVCGIVVLRYEHSECPLDARWRDWFLIAAGGVIVVVSCCWDYSNIMAGGLPNPFNWSVFAVGIMLSFATFLSILIRRLRRPVPQ